MAAVEAVDAAIVIKELIEEVLGIKLPPLKLVTDNKSLVDTSRTSNVISDKRLMIDMAALREMTDRNELVIEWTSTDKQLADVLTKSGVDNKKLLDVVSRGYIC